MIVKETRCNKWANTFTGGSVPWSPPLQPLNPFQETKKMARSKKIGPKVSPWDQNFKDHVTDGRYRS